MEIILAPNSALRNGRFASSPKSHVHDDFDAFGYNLQPVLDVNPRNSLRRVVSPTKTQKVAFPSQVKESSIQYFPTSVPSDSSPKKKHSKKSKLPTTGFGKSGQIQSRTGAKPLPFQKWTQSWWLHVYPATLNLFESEEKMNQWKAMHASDSTSTSTKGPINKRETANAKIKNKLLLASIDFDTEHNLEKKINSFEAREKGDLPLHDAAQHDTRDDISSKKIIAYEAAKKSTAVKFVMEDVRSKYYARNGPLM